MLNKLAPTAAAPPPGHVIRRHLPEGASARCAFSIIIPAYNEQMVLEATVDRIAALLKDVDDYEMVIVEDGCTDYTPLMAAELRSRYANVQHIHSAVRLGKGRAVAEGIRAARGQVVVLMDADMATDPAELLRFVNIVARKDADIVIGSRYHDESRTRRTGLRLLYSRAYNGAARLLLRSRVRDHQCGFKVFDADAMRSILPFVKAERFFWDTEVLAVAQWFGYRVREVPITWKEGEASKVRLFRTPAEMFGALVRLAIMRRWRVPRLPAPTAPAPVERVAMVAPYPRGEDVHSEHGLGGVSAYARNLVAGFGEATEVLVVAPSTDPAPPRREANVVVAEFPQARAGKAIRALKRDPTITAVHVQFEQHIFGGPLQNVRLARALRSLRRKKRVVVTVHQVPSLAEVDRPFLRQNGFPPLPFLARAWMRFQYKLLARGADVLIVHEERLAERLIGPYGVSPSRVKVVPHGVDKGELPCGAAEAKSRLGIGDRALILYFGYVTGYKGVDLLVTALERLPPHIRERAQVVIAGKVPPRKMENAAFRAEIEDVERRIEALGAWVTRKGFLEPAEISLHLAAADVVVFPYRNVFGASGPLAITIGHGRPFLASEAFVGMGLPEDALFPTHADALAAKLMAFLDDPAMRARIEASARRLASERSWPSVARRTQAHYAAAGRPRVLLMGAYGQDNLGDEALLEVHLQQLSDMRLTVGSSDPAQTRHRYAVAAVPTYGGFDTVRAFRDCDAVVFGGGSVVKELPAPYPRHRVLGSLALLSTFAHGLGRRVVFSAVGVEKIKTRVGAALARRIGRSADAVLVRDEGSRRLLRELRAHERVRVVADAAYLLEEDDKAAERAKSILKPAAGRPVVILNPIASHEVDRSANQVAAAFAALVDDVHERLDAHVLLLPFKTTGSDADVPVAKDVLRRVREPARVSMAPLDLRPAEALALLRRAEFVVAMRHHGVLLSLVAQTPVLAVPYAPKTQHLVEEWGLAVSLPASAINAPALRDAFWRAYVDRAEQRDAVRPVLDRMRRRARLNFAYLREAIASKETG